MFRPGKKPRTVRPTSRENQRYQQARANTARIEIMPRTLPSSAEKKFKDTTVPITLAAGSISFPAIGAANLLNGLVPDATATGRIGRSINMKSLLVRFSCLAGPTATGSASYRILVIYDKQPNAAFPVGGVTDILLTDAFNSPNNLSNRDRFVTIFDEVTPAISGTGGGDQSYTGVLFKKLNLETRYNGGVAGTIADITTGSLFLFVAQSGGLTTVGSTFTASCRIRYEDK